MAKFIEAAVDQTEVLPCGEGSHVAALMFFVHDDFLLVDMWFSCAGHQSRKACSIVLFRSRHCKVLAAKHTRALRSFVGIPAVVFVASASARCRVLAPDRSSTGISAVVFAIGCGRSLGTTGFGLTMLARGFRSCEVIASGWLCGGMDPRRWDWVFRKRLL